MSAVVCNSKRCRAQAAKCRQKFKRAYKARRQELDELGAFDVPVDEEEQQHVVKPHLASKLCDCPDICKLLVYWYDLEELRQLLQAVETRAALVGPDPAQSQRLKPVQMVGMETPNDRPVKVRITATGIVPAASFPVHERQLPPAW